VHPQFYEASFTIILALSLAIYTLVHGQPGHTKRIFLALVMSIIIWSGGVAFSRLLSDPDAARVAVEVSFVGIFMLPPLWYTLALHLARRTQSEFAWPRMALMTVPSVLAFAAMASNPLHHLYIREPESIVMSSPQVWAGPLFWVWSGWAYSLVIAASIRYLGWSWQLVSNDAKWRGALVFSASLLPLSGNLAHLLDLTPPGHDSTPLMLGVATVMLFVADWRFRMLDTLPVARRDVIEQLHDGVLMSDAQGVILDMNPAAERMVEAPLSELAGQPIVRAIANQSHGRFDFDEEVGMRIVVDMCRSAKGFDVQIENYAGRHFEVRGAAVTDAAGDVSGLYIIMHEITERNRLEEVQRESRRAQTIASLAAGITHEVNNPLAYVRANVSHVLDEIGSIFDEKDAGDDLRPVLEEALEGIDRIGTIVERVRKFTQTRGGVRERFSIEGIFEEAKRVRARASDARIAVTISTDPTLTPVLGVRDGLLEAILNLLDNAEHALEKDGGTIRLRALQAGSSVRIEIEDDGPGVPAALRERIFEPFVTTDDNEAGSGLGLAISEKLIADFGGRLTHENVAAGGSRFVIELPVNPTA